MRAWPRADNEAVQDRKHMLIWACVAGSLAVHAVSMVILSILPSPERPRLVDAPEPSLELSTDLTLAPPEPSAVPEPAVMPPEPVAPEPSPTPEQEPAPEEPETKPETKTEIAPQPAAIALPAEPKAPVEEPRPAAPAPSKPATSVPPAPARVQPSAPKAAPASFAGAKTVRASTIVYAVDASGAMASSLSIVLEELRRSVARLTPEQKFTVILFHETPGRSTGHESFSSQPIAATPDNLRKLDAFLATARPGGRSNPLLGLEPALECRPDLIFFLARSIRRSGPGASWGPGKAAVLTRLNELNSVDAKTGRRPVVIKTIQFLEPDPTGLMNAIGTIHGDGPGSAVVYTLPATPG